MSGELPRRPRRISRRGLAIVLASLVSVACVVGLAASIDVDLLLSATKRAEAGWLAAAAAMHVGILVLRAVRWRFLFRDAVRLGDLFWSQAVGYLASNVLPLRAGDLVRFGWLLSRCNAPATEVAFTIVLERFLDVLTLLFLGAGALALAGSRFYPQTSLAGFGALALATGLAIAAVTAWLPRTPLYNQLAPRLQRWLSELAHCVRDMLSWRGAVVLPVTLLCAAASVGYAWLIIRSMVPQVSVLDAAMATAAVMVAMAIPAAPGAIGTFHVAASVALTKVSGYSAETAIVISVLLHSIQYIGGSAIGLVGLAMWRGPALRDAAAMARDGYVVGRRG